MNNAWPQLDELLTQLSARGYDDAFDAAAAGLRARSADRVFEPEELAVDELTRVSHPFDPDHDRFVFALRDPNDGVRGVYAAPCRAANASDDARMIERLRRKAPASADRGATFRVNDRRWWTRSNGDGHSPPADSAPTYIAQLEAKLRAAEARLRETAGMAREAQDEIERAKARVERDAERQLRLWQSSFLGGFIELLDDLDRALAAASAGASGDGVREGVELVRRRFLAKLSEQGVSRVEPHGEPFDPHRDEAVSTVRVPPDQDGIVVDVLTPGYIGKDGVLRPALVVVGQAARAAATD